MFRWIRFVVSNPIGNGCSIGKRTRKYEVYESNEAAIVFKQRLKFHIFSHIKNDDVSDMSFLIFNCRPLFLIKLRPPQIWLILATSARIIVHPNCRINFRVGIKRDSCRLFFISFSLFYYSCICTTFVLFIIFEASKLLIFFYLRETREKKKKKMKIWEYGGN